MKQRIRTLVLGWPEALGYAVRHTRRPVRFLPELAGLILVAWGVGMIYVPAGVIVSGVALVLAGSRIPR